MLFEDASVVEHVKRYAASRQLALPPGALPRRLAETPWDELMPRVPSEASWALLELLEDRLGPDAPARSAIFPIDLSLSCLFAVASGLETLGEAIDCLVRYSPAITNYFAWKAERSDDEVVLVPVAPPATRPGQRHTLEWHLVDTVNTSRQLAQYEGQLRLVSVLPAPATQALSAALGIAVTAGQPRAELVLSRAALAARLGRKWPSGPVRASRWVVDGALAARRPAQTVSQQVLAALEQRLSQGAVAVDEVARALAMSRRTLARRLASEGTRYEELLDAARNARAAALLGCGSSDAQIAEALGLSARSYFRSMRRWFGATPGALRGAR
jgi:AraC-like DNA-binding protein